LKQKRNLQEKRLKKKPQLDCKLRRMKHQELKQKKKLQGKRLKKMLQLF